MTKEELATGDGMNGRPAWVAVGGKVYDFTTSGIWREGEHKGMHRAGRDLTAELQGAPHVRAVIERFPVVGELEEAKVPLATGPGMGRLLVGFAAVLAVLMVLWLALR